MASNRPTNMLTLCPSGYSMLMAGSTDFFSELKEWNGWDADYDTADFLEEAYELTPSQVTQIANNFKQWNDVIPSGYGTSEDYVVPVDVVDNIGDWGGNIFLNDVGDLYCDGLGFNVFILSTEAWGML